MNWNLMKCGGNISLQCFMPIRFKYAAGLATGWRITGEIDHGQYSGKMVGFYTVNWHKIFGGFMTACQAIIMTVGFSISHLPTLASDIEEQLNLRSLCLPVVKHFIALFQCKYELTA